MSRGGRGGEGRYGIGSGREAGWGGRGGEGWGRAAKLSQCTYFEVIAILAVLLV